MNLKPINTDFSVCKINTTKDFDFSCDFWFLSQTDEELSLVCETKAVPEKTIEREDGWRAFRIEGILDFSLIGILSEISTVLAENEIGIFAASTFNTDYILVKENNYEKALKVLQDAGNVII